MEAPSRPPKTYAELRAWLLEVDPELVQAADDVDLTLLEAAARLTPTERLRAASAMQNELERLRDLPRR